MARTLHPEVEIVVEGSAAPQPVRGAEAVAAALLALLTPETVLEGRQVNGAAGLAMLREGQVVGVLALAVRWRLIDHLWVVLDPARLGHWTR